MIFILGVIIVNSKTRGYILGFICSTISVILFNYLFTKPRYSLHVIGRGIKYLSRLLERTVICYLAQENKLSTSFIYTVIKGGKDRSLLNKDEEAAAYWTFVNDKESGAGTNTFYGAKGYYIHLNYIRRN